MEIVNVFKKKIKTPCLCIETLNSSNVRDNIGLFLLSYYAEAFNPYHTHPFKNRGSVFCPGLSFSWGIPPAVQAWSFCWMGYIRHAGSHWVGRP